MENEAPNLLAWSLVISSPNRDFTHSLNSQITDLLFGFGVWVCVFHFSFSFFFFFSKSYLFSGRTPAFLFHVQPGGLCGGGLFGGVVIEEQRRTGGLREEMGGGAGLPAAAPPHSGQGATPRPCNPPLLCQQSLPLSSCPLLRQLPPNLSQRQSRNYTLHLYNKCSHIHDLISASSSPGRRGGARAGAPCSCCTGGDTEARGREATCPVSAKSEGRFA